ncbi:hypothetical protein [Roseibium sp.]|uniref:hypothetical protein n=1 Tax=Roseibium sp. TaxID=1936156 RepID=UPI003D138C81
MKTSVVTILSAITAAGSAMAADPFPYDPGMSGEVYTASTLRGSIGLRYWYSQGSNEFNGALGTANAENVTGHTAEVFGILEDISTRTSAKTMVGFGKNSNGDQTWVGLESNDWNTTNLGYVLLDGGWEVAKFAGGKGRIKALVGYHYLSDKTSATYFGTQKRAMMNKWHALRLGVAADGELSDRIGWSIDAAAVPWSYNQFDDGFNTLESEYTYGFEADAALNVALTSNWDIGVGGRYWWLHSEYELDQDQTYQRYGLLIESKYKF